MAHIVQQDEVLIPLSAAAKQLEISRGKMTLLVQEGVFPVYHDPYDKRKRLVRLSEVERLMSGCVTPFCEAELRAKVPIGLFRVFPPWPWADEL